MSSRRPRERVAANACGGSCPDTFGWTRIGRALEARLAAARLSPAVVALQYNDAPAQQPPASRSRQSASAKSASCRVRATASALSSCSSSPLHAHSTTTPTPRLL